MGNVYDQGVYGFRGNGGGGHDQNTKRKQESEVLRSTPTDGGGQKLEWSRREEEENTGVGEKKRAFAGKSLLSAALVEKNTK